MKTKNGNRGTAEKLLYLCRTRGLMIATAESCTGGMITAALTDIAGSSDVVDRGFITYSNQAKADMLGVPKVTIAEFGAVSEEVARAMACGAVIRSRADIAVAVTGIAGPGGGSVNKPVGLVHLAAASKSGLVLQKECMFANQTREEVRTQTVAAAFEILNKLIEKN